MSDKIDVDALEKAFPWMDTSEFIADYVRDLFDTIRQLQDENADLSAQLMALMIAKPQEPGDWRSENEIIETLWEDIEELEAENKKMGRVLEQVETASCKLLAENEELQRKNMMPSGPRPCTWDYDPDDDIYMTGCGETFQFTNDSDLQENKFFYCYHCGGEIYVKR